MNLSFTSVALPAHIEAFRGEVRAFLADTLRERTALQRAESWNGADPEFSRKLGQRGWIGMTWPRAYGGSERSTLERYVLIEELLAAGAPVAAHWFGDRQVGPNLLKFGTEAQRTALLPPTARGECYFCIGMSEPDVGSDLASVRTRAEKTSGGYIVRGTKLWTSYAHNAHFMILLARTDTEAAKHAGLSQFIVDMKSPGITVSPIRFATGEHHFNAVVFTDVFVPDDSLLGAEGQGWAQVMSELAFERSGPERFLSAIELLSQMFALAQRTPSPRSAEALGRVAAHLATLRSMSLSVAASLADGASPDLEAAIVKDLGALVEQEIPELARRLFPPETDETYRAVLEYTTMHAPSFSLRGGTREILRGIIARGLGLR
jgi:alkylation response protein AidB-like acyl-CoA dehydrogenase